jgi:uncharacterized membrane protein
MDAPNGVILHARVFAKEGLTTSKYLHSINMRTFHSAEQQQKPERVVNQIPVLIMAAYEPWSLEMEL